MNQYIILIVIGAISLLSCTVERSNAEQSTFIAVADLDQSGVGIERSIKARLTAVANIIALQHGFAALP